MKRFLAIFILLLPTLPALAQKDAGQENAIRPGDNLRLENIPPIPASIADKAAQYGEIRTAFLADWEPSRRDTNLFVG